MARRFGTVATFYKYAVIDGVIPANPAAAVTRPKVAWEGQKRTVLHPLEFAALLAAARTSGSNDHALVCLLGMLGLQVSDACATDIASAGPGADSIATRGRLAAKDLSRDRRSMLDAVIPLVDDVGLVSPVAGAPRFDQPGISAVAQAFHLLATTPGRLVTLEDDRCTGAGLP